MNLFGVCCFLLLNIQSILSDTSQTEVQKVQGSKLRASRKIWRPSSDKENSLQNEQDLKELQQYEQKLKDFISSNYDELQYVQRLEDLLENSKNPNEVFSAPNGPSQKGQNTMTELKDVTENGQNLATALQNEEHLKEVALQKGQNSNDVENGQYVEISLQDEQSPNETLGNGEQNLNDTLRDGQNAREELEEVLQKGDQNPVIGLHKVLQRRQGYGGGYYGGGFGGYGGGGFVGFDDDDDDDDEEEDFGDDDDEDVMLRTGKKKKKGKGKKKKKKGCGGGGYGGGGYGR